MICSGSTLNANAPNAKLFASIRKQLSDASVVIPLQQSELYETVTTRVFQDYWIRTVSGSSFSRRISVLLLYATVGIGLGPTGS
jgi:hypothetical protein